MKLVMVMRNIPNHVIKVHLVSAHAAFTPCKVGLNLIHLCTTYHSHWTYICNVICLSASLLCVVEICLDCDSI